MHIYLFYLSDSCHITRAGFVCLLLLDRKCYEVNSNLGGSPPPPSEIMFSEMFSISNLNFKMSSDM